MVESSAELRGSLLWRTYIEEAADLIFTLDAAGKIAFVNRAVCETTGYTAQELLGKNPLEFIPSEMHELVETTFRKMLGGDKLHRVELEVLSKDGRYIPLEVSGRALYDGGRIVGTVQMGRDVTERKRMEEKLRESEERFRGIAERSFDVIFTMDREGRVTYVSPAVRRILGYKPEEVVGQPIQNYLPESEIPKAFQSLGEALQGKVPEYLEFEVRRKDGSLASSWIGASAIVRDGTVIGAQAILRDITERKKMEKAVRGQADLLRKTLNSMTDAVFILEAKAPPTAPTILECNEAASAIFGFDRTELMGKATDFLHVSEETLREFQSQLYTAVQQSRLPFHLHEFRMKRKDGSIFPSEHSVSQLLNEKGERTGWVSIVRDITERKLAEEALRESEEKYRRLFEQALDGIALADAETGIILDCNQALAALVGRDRAELIGQHQAILHPPASDGSAFSPTFKLHTTTHEGQVLETQAITSTGQIREVEVKANLLYLQGRKTVQGLFRDITERKRAEDALRWRAEELAALQATLLDITGRHDLPRLLQTIVERAVRLLGAPAGGMYICDHEKQEVRCVVSYNTPHDYTGTRLKYGEGAAGIVAQTGKPFIIDDYRSWQGRATVYEEEQPFTAVLTVPMIWQDHVTGVIHVLDDTVSRRFTLADQELLTLFANHAAIAVENARLLEQEKHHAEELTHYSTNLEQLVSERTSKLAESERRFRELADLLPQIVFEIDEKGKLQFMNRAAFASTGRGEEDLRKGLNAFDMFVPEEHERAVQGIRRIMAGETISGREFTLVRRDGTTCPVLVYTAPVMREGKAVGLRGIAIDITERRKMEEELRDARERLEYLITSNPAVIYSGKPLADLSDWDLTYLSQRVKSMLGFEPWKFIGDPEFWERHVHLEDLRPTMAQVPRLWKEGQHTFEYRFLHKDGTYRWIREEATVVRDAHGKPTEVNGYWIDVTEPKRLEEALAKSQRLATIGELAAMVGHDLRNPLQGIAGAAYYLRTEEKSKLSKQGKEMVQLIQESIGRSDKIINDLLEYSKELHLELSKTNVKSITKDALTKVKIPKGVHVVNLTENQPPIKLDVHKMRRVFMNLIRNAFDAMPKGGTLTITSSRIGGSLHIAFKDTGEGMTRETLAKLWSPLFTTKAKGMGLGLAIIKRFVEAHEGSIDVESKPREGSTFTVTLPIKRGLKGEEVKKK